MQKKKLKIKSPKIMALIGFFSDKVQEMRCEKCVAIRWPLRYFCTPQKRPSTKKNNELSERYYENKLIHA